eukprot:g13173.t1
MLAKARRGAALLAFAPSLIIILAAASLAGVADGSLGARASTPGSPPIDSAWTRRPGDFLPSSVILPSSVRLHNHHPWSLDKVARLRGGVKRATVKADDEGDDTEEAEEDGLAGPVSALTGVFKNMPPMTRASVILIMIITAVDVTKLIDAGETYSLDWGKTIKGLELWRPLTSLVYLGPLSMSWLTNVYFLTQHGTRLEMVSGTAEQLIFLLVVGSLLLALGSLIGMPFMATSMVAAHTHVSARMEPLGVVQFQFLRIPLWTLPFAQMGAAVLQKEGNVLAAIPHLVGILCGHVYHFFTVVHPLMGAKRRVGAPAWMKRRLDGDNPNFMEAPDEPAAPRGRKIGAGKRVTSKSKGKSKGASKGELGGGKKGKSKPIPEFPTAGGGCS